MRNKTLAVTLTHWEVLNTNLQLHQDELPGLQPSQEALAVFIEDVRATAAEQAEADGVVRGAVARRTELVRQGNHLQQYITAVLRREFGASSPRLVQFGVRPRALRRLPSTTPDDPDGEPENPAPPPSDS